MLKAALFCCLLTTIGTIASAQNTELKPLSDVLSSDFEESYIPMRCGGVFMSMAKYAGETQLGVEGYNNLLSNADSLLRVSASIRTEFNEKTEQENYVTILQEAVFVAQNYLNRFQSNYIENGSAWSSDPAFLEDVSICKSLQRQ